MRRKTAVVYQLKITLKGLRPPIWRRVLVPADLRLSNLHEVIQAVMGWYNCHMHSFEIDGEEYGVPDDELELEDEGRARLSQLVPHAGTRFSYVYDFGDDWRHEVLVEQIMPAAPGVTYPVCVTGKRACPPEDCGGAWGYRDLLEALRDPDHPEHAELREWAGADLDPEAFDPAQADARLRRC